MTPGTALPSLTCLFNLILVNQTIHCLLVCGVLHLLLVQELEEVRGGESRLACGVALVQIVDFGSPGGRGLAFPHLALQLHIMQLLDLKKCLKLPTWDIQSREEFVPVTDLFTGFF